MSSISNNTNKKVLYRLWTDERGSFVVGKEAIKEVNLAHDVTIADAHTKEYHEKLIKLQAMAKELGLMPSSSTSTTTTKKENDSSSSFVNTNPYAAT